MAKKKEQVEESKPLKKISYYAKYYGYGFLVPRVDEDGKIVYAKNNQGGDIVDVTTGNKKPIMLNYKFTNIEPLTSKGYLSKFEWDPSDESAQNMELKKTLDKLDQDEGVSVEIEDKYEQRINPKAYIEKKRAEELEGKVANLESQLNDPEALQRRLEELTRP